MKMDLQIEKEIKTKFFGRTKYNFGEKLKSKPKFFLVQEKASHFLRDLVLSLELIKIIVMCDYIVH